MLSNMRTKRVVCPSTMSRVFGGYPESEGEKFTGFDPDMLEGEKFTGFDPDMLEGEKFTGFVAGKADGEKFTGFEAREIDGEEFTGFWDKCESIYKSTLH